MRKLINNIKNFSGYIVRYFTHYEILSIVKNNDLLKPNVWYDISLFLKLGKDKRVYINDIKISKQKTKRRKKNGNKKRHARRS